MRIEKGRSAHPDADLAVNQAVADMTGEPEIVFVFASTSQDPAGVYRALSARFPDSPIVGCTTAGEQIDEHHSNGGLVVLSASETGMSWSVEVLEALDKAQEEDVARSVGSLIDASGIDTEELKDHEAVCLLFIDGLSGTEERISASLAEALEGIPLAGGSAGDDLKFEETRVFGPGGAQTNAAVLVLARSLDGSPVRVIKHQHFKSTPKSLVVTSAEGRTVHEFDGYPAVEGYARALGVATEEVTADLCFMHPVTFACNGELYVRSIRALDDDGSIHFYCAVEEGMVLDVGGHHDMQEALRSDLLSDDAPRPELIISFNCILRALEATAKDLHDALGATLENSSDNLVGFDTYGEQLNGLHINQTLVAACFGAAS